MFNTYVFRGSRIINSIVGASKKDLWAHLNSYKDERLDIHVFQGQKFISNYKPTVGFV